MGKWLAACMTTGAAAATILRYLHIAGLIGSEPHRLAAEATWVGLSPVADTVHSIGDTVRLVATATDRFGTSLPGAATARDRDQPDVAAVDSTGIVVARGEGAAAVSVTIGSQSAQAQVLVHPIVEEVHLSFDSTLRVPEGHFRQVFARALDARGFELARTPVWVSSDSTVATVDSSGSVWGVAPGRTRLAATVEGVTAHTEIRVVPAPAFVTVRGEGQRAPAGQPLAEPTEVEVLSDRRQPIGNVPVEFVAVDPHGNASVDTTLTDPAGRARTRWILTDVPGQQRLRITVDGFDSSITVMAEADPIAANTRVVPVSSAVRGLVGEPLAEPYGVLVTDSIGRVLPTVPVSWAPLDGGVVTPAAERTDSLGRAWAKWTLGPTAGKQRIRVQVGSGRTAPPATLSVGAGPGPPASAVVVRGGDQRATVGAALERIIIDVRDSFGNPIPGADLALSPAAGNVLDSAVQTDSSGHVAVSWTLGREAGLQRLSVRLPTSPLGPATPRSNQCSGNGCLRKPGGRRGRHVHTRGGKRRADASGDGYRRSCSYQVDIGGHEWLAIPDSGRRPFGSPVHYHGRCESIGGRRPMRRLE